MAKFLEKRHEISTAARVADVRPFSVKLAEWLSSPWSLFICALPLALVPMVLPVLLLPAFLAYCVALAVYVFNRPLLPLRYSAARAKSAPGGKADGILMFGNVRSSSPYEMFKEAWLADDDLRKHFLIIGSTGSGKSETLKGILFNALCWSSGYFVADGKADNKLPTDNYCMVRSVGRDDDLLVLNFLLGGSTPQQVASSRRRRTNGTNPFSSADADTIIQMGSNMLPKVEGEGKNWQEKALNLWRALVVALCYKRDMLGMELSVTTFIEYMALPKIEELYLEGYDESRQRGEWSYGFVGIKSYLDSGCPAYKVEKLIAKHEAGGSGAPAGMMGMGGRPGAGAAGKAFEQDGMAYEQHAYRSSQLMPVLNLLDKTYGFIFRDKFPEIDMIDVTLNNRILLMLIPSLEKSASEAENLGKLAIACLRVMMGKNLGANIEGGRRELLESKATNAPYPYIVALDELAYYFSDGIAVMCAQARSLGFSMMALCQDLEKLTEGNRAPEAGAMMANQVSKYFMRVDDAKKTWDLVREIVGKTTVAVYRDFEYGALGWSRKLEVDLQEVERVTLTELQGMKAGQGVFNSCGETMRLSSFYMGKDLEKHKVDYFHINRFLQVRAPTLEDILPFCTSLDAIEDKVARGERRLKILRGDADVNHEVLADPVITAVADLASVIPKGVSPPERGIALYQAARAALVAQGLLKLPDEEAADKAVKVPAAQSEAAPVPNQLDPSQILREAAGPESLGPSAVDDQDPIQPDASAEDDLLDFLRVPFQRKHVDEVLAPTVAKAKPASAPPKAPAPAPAAAPAAPAAEVEDPVRRILARSFQVSLSALPVEPPQEVNTGASAAAPSRVLADRVVHLSHKPGEASEAPDWMEQSITASRDVLRTMAGADEKVVGFTGDVLDRVEKIETLLGNTKPQEAAKTLEQVVSAKVTPPDLNVQDELTADAVNAIFDTLSMPSQR